MTDLRKIPRRKIMSPEAIREWAGLISGSDELLDDPLEEWFTRLIGGDGPPSKLPKWAWTITVRTCGDDPEGEFLGAFPNFWDAVAHCVNLFTYLDPERDDCGCWDDTIFWEYADQQGMTREEFDDLNSCFRFEVTWKGQPAIVVLDSVRIGRLPRMG